LILLPLFFIGVRGGTSPAKKPITISNAGDYVDRVIHTAAVLNTPFSIIRTIGKADFTHQKFYSSYQEMEPVFSPYHCPDSLTIQSSAADDDSIVGVSRAIKLEGGELNGKNIVLLLLEGFNYENMKFLNPELERSYTPFLDSLSKEALVCTNAFANGRKSIDAIPSLFISVPSLVQSYAVTPYSTDYTYGLPKIVDSLGYYTAFLHGAPNTSMGIRAVSRLCGMMNYFGKDEYGNDDHFDGAWGIWDEHFLQFAAKKIGEFPQPFFANIFTLSSHHPFLLPDEYKDVYNEGTPRQRVIEYTDMAIRKFFKSIENTEWFNNTLFVIVSDHSVLVGEKPQYNTTIGNTRIPIIYYSPGFVKPGKYTGVTQQIDIMPTLLGMLNYNKPYFAFGRDINSSFKPHFAINYTEGQFQLVVGDTLLFRNNSELKAIYLLNEDPLLKNNLLDSSNYDSKSLDMDLVQKQDSWFKAFIQQYVNRLIDNKLSDR
ncbi:MAG: LTA synthase family protein, partial [Bacteroidales bacterium]|nr:LTA synthase family protein [Bacteroidales bacterium]